MDQLCQIQRLLQANNSVDTLQELCTPFFQSGLLLPRDSWVGSIVTWGWGVACVFGLGDEKKELEKILSVAQRAFLAIQKKDFETQNLLSRKYIALSYFHDYAEKIQACACRTLGSSTNEWHEAMRIAQKQYCFDLVDDVTGSETTRSIFREVVERTQDSGALRRRAEWIEGAFPLLSHMPSRLLWDCFERILEENGAQCVDESAACSFAFDLLKIGLRLDQVVDRDCVTQNTIEPIRLIDERFRCCSFVENPGRMVLFAQNGFLIPLWRAFVAHEKTLFRVIDCYAIDDSRSMAYVEGVLGRFEKVGLDFPRAFDELCDVVQKWVEARMRVHPKAQDLWISYKGNIVTFAPVYEQEEPFSVVEVERFIHSLGLSSARRREMYIRIGFFDLVEFRALEDILKDLSCVSDHDIARVLAGRGIEDVGFYAACIRIMHRYTTEEQRKKYLQKAHDEGFFL